MTDWNTPPPSGASPAPAEGLPPCYSVSALDGHVAILHDSRVCGKRGTLQTHRFIMGAGDNSYVGKGNAHPELQVPQLNRLSKLVSLIHTDDPAEAQAAFERGAEYVRTGTLT